MNKITDILDEFVTRCEGIAGVRAAVKRKRQFNPEETPAVSIYRGPTESVDHDESGPNLLEMPVTVDYYREQTGEEDSSGRAETMVNEILAVIETDDGAYMDGNLCESVYALSDDVLLPDDAGGIIRSSVIFNTQFTRPYGGG